MLLRSLRSWLGVATVVAVTGASIAAARQTPAAPPTVRPPATARRSGHTTTILADGRVLLAGGRAEQNGTLYWMAPAALFDPSVGRIEASGELIGVREQHQATRLVDGTVLITGGMGPAGSDPALLVPLATAEVFDPAVGRFKSVGAMTRPRSGHTAELQPDGRVLISGGEAAEVRASTSELYDPRSASFTAVGSAGGTRGR